MLLSIYKPRKNYKIKCFLGSFLIEKITLVNRIGRTAEQYSIYYYSIEPSIYILICHVGRLARAWLPAVCLHTGQWTLNF